MVLADHRFALISPKRPSALDKKSFSIGSAFQQLALPLRDDLRVNVEPLSDLDQWLFALDGLQGHLGLERR